MPDEFGTKDGLLGDFPSYFPTDTDGKLVPVYNQSGRFTGQLQKDGRVAVDTHGPAENDAAADARRASEDMGLNLQALADAIPIQQEMLSAMDRLTAALATFRTEMAFEDVAIPAPGANTDIIKGGIVIRELPWRGVKALEVTVTLATASVFNYTRTRKNNAGATIGILESVALGAGDGFGPIRIPVTEFDTINFRVETDGIITQLIVEAKFR